MKLVLRLYEAIKNDKKWSKPPRLADLERELGLSRKNRNVLKGALRELQDRGAIVRLKGGRYCVDSGDPEKETSETIKGVYHHKAAGYGFVDSGKPSQGVFIPPGRSGSAMDRDVVEARIYPGRPGKGPEGKVLNVIKRNRTFVAGTVLRLENEWILEPDDPGLGLAMDLEPPDEDLDELSVIAEVIRFPRGPEESPLAKVSEVLGPPGNLDTESRKILFLGGIEEEFSEEVIEEAAKSARENLHMEEGGVPRRDLRELPFFTIDPVDARDFDDAVCVEVLEDGRHRLWVAIADVSHFVGENTACDEEAEKRGFSAYLPHRAVPMLPESLSSDACSLIPHVDRKAMVVAMDIGYKGESKPHWMGPAVINSKARLDYGVVANVLSGEPRIRKELGQPLVDHVLRLKDLGAILVGKRRRRGMLEIATAEEKVVFASEEELEIADVIRQKQGKWKKKAYGLIEQCMLEANETVGAFLAQKGVAVPWRIHPEADTDKLERFSTLLKGLGHTKMASKLDPSSAPTPKMLAGVARGLKDLPEWEAEALGPYLLSCLMQATYSPVNEGHFALAAKHYVHFTSPIRRYPDLMVHRALKRVWKEESHVRGEGPAKEERHKRGEGHAKKEGHREEGHDGSEKGLSLEETALMLSERERVIVDVERQAVDLFSASLMQSHIGDEYEGTVHTVMPFGAFVRLDHPYVEGLVRFAQDDDWEDDGTGLFFVARRSGRRLGPASRLKVRVLDVSLLRRQIEFELVEEAKKS